MKTIIVWTIIIIGELAGFYLIIAGYRKKMSGGPEFKVKHLFQNNPVEKNSGAQLIVEGIGAMFSGFILYYVFFIW